MTVSSIGGSSSTVQSILSLRRQLDDLQRQLGTGQKADTFAGLASQSGLAVALQTQLASIGSYDDTMTTVGMRLSISQNMLQQISQIGHGVKGSTTSPMFDLDTSGQTSGQKNARDQLDQIIGLLNTQVGDRYLFSGVGTDQPSVETTDHILNGNGALAGLKQVVAERRTADLGANGLGRLVIPAASATAAALVGTGATLLPDQATGTGTVGSLTAATTLASLGVTVNDDIILDDGVNTTNYTVQAGDTVATLMAALSNQVGGANAAVTLQNGFLQIQSNDTTSTITISDNAGTPGADATALGFGPGNTSFTPNTLLSQGAVASNDTLIVTVGSATPTTITFGNGPGEVSTLAGLNAALAAIPGVTASVNLQNGNITITASNTVDPITITGSADPTKFGLSATSSVPTGGISLSEDVAPSVFGLKITAMSSLLTGATATGPAGAPPAISVNLTGNPVNGETLKVTFRLPDGTSEDLVLKATTAASPGPNEFAIGATPAATAANLQAALTTGVGKLAGSSLAAASAVTATQDFFGNPPMRVQGAPATATTLVAGSAADTVFWYTGENGALPPRATATARIDQSITISYGLRANEEGLRWVMQSVATLAATSYATSDPNATASYTALCSRVGGALGIPAPVQKIADIEASLGSAQAAIQSAKERQAQTQNVLTNMLQDISGISQEQVGAQILALQTTLQASLATTARLAQISIINYL